MEIFRIVGGEIQSNGYVLFDGPGGQATIIDPGFNPDRFEAFLEEKKLSLASIILTHHHYDHVGAVSALVDHWACPVYMQPQDSPFVDFETRSAQEGDILTIGGYPCYVSDLPGHTKGGLGLYFPRDRAFFTGDTVFVNEIGLTNLAGGSPKEMAESCLRIYKWVPEDVMIYAGHGQPATMAQLLDINEEFKEALENGRENGYDKDLAPIAGLKNKDMKYKLLALDLDGTTLDDFSSLSPGNKAALIKAMEAGVHVVVATGRSFSSLPDVVLFLDGLEYTITSNGGEIRNLREGRILNRSCISKEAVMAVYDQLCQDPHMIEVFVEGHPYIEQAYFDQIADGTVKSRSRGYVMATRNPIPDIMGFLKDKAGNVENINIFFEDQDDKEQMRQKLSKIPHMNLTSSMPENLEVGGENTSKGDGVAYLVDYLGISQEEVIACGDNPNDASMVVGAGLGVAVGNADQSLKDLADLVTVTNKEDAVAKIIEEYIFGEKGQQ